MCKDVPISVQSFLDKQLGKAKFWQGGLPASVSDSTRFAVESKMLTRFTYEKMCL